MKRLVRTLPWTLFALVIVGWAPGLYYDQFSYEVTVTSDLVWAASFFAFPVVGLVLTLRIPSNAVGWLFLVGPAWAGAGVATTEYGEAIDAPSVQLLGNYLLSVGLLCLVAAIVLFPDGRYPSRWIRSAHVLSLTGLVSAAALLPGDSPVIGIFMAANLLLGVVSLASRAIRGDATMRRQIAAPVLVAVVGVMTLAAVYTLIPDEFDPGGWSQVVAFMLLTLGIPISIALSITRYRLYEIDRIIARTVSYSLVAGLLAIVVAGVATLAGAQFEEPWVVAATTLGVAAVFNPLRRRVQRWVDRRFNRSRYDAERVMDDFAGSLRDRVDTDEVIRGWLGVVDATMQPETIGVWLRV